VASLLPRSITFGIRLPNSGPFAGADAIRRIAARAEALGFDTVWVHDHLAWPTHRRSHFAAGSVEAIGDQPPHFFESLTTLACLAGATRRVRLGIAGLVLPWRDPRLLAKQLATVAELADGRLVPAFAIGRYEDEFAVQQVPYHQRGRITDEYLACLVRVLGQEPVSTFDGERVRFANAEYWPKPTRLPLWICGMHPHAWRRVARYGDGWLPGGLTPDEHATAVKALEAVLAEHGRSLDEIDCATEIFTTIAPTDEEAARIAEASLRHQWGDVAQGQARSLVGSPDSVRSRVAAYVAAGVTHFELKFICHHLSMMEEMMEQYARRVVPEFR
jgi:probable F420-dependent oxidoreductase